MSTVVHKPGRELDDPKELLLGFLDYYRSVIIRKVDGLTDAELRASRLPSGWTPLELLKHLAYMERRWLRWGFRAEQLPDPHGDEDQAGRWHAGPGDTAASLIAALRAAGEQTRAIASAAELTDISTPGGRFRDSDPRPLPTLAWILTYVLQEYARHAGHLDVAREVIDGTTGELPGDVGRRHQPRGRPGTGTAFPDHDHKEKAESRALWRWVTWHAWPRPWRVRLTAPAGLAEWRYHGRLVARQLDDAQLVIRADFDYRDSMLRQFPETFSVPARYINHMMVVADLARGDAGAIEDALEAAWQLQRSAD